MRRPTCATELLARAVRHGLGRDETGDALVTLVAARLQEFDFADARRWAAELRRQVPTYNGIEIGELESGMTEAIADYQEGRLPDALRGFSAIAARADTPDERRRHAYYYAALTLFCMRRVGSGIRWADAYRSLYGDDAASGELRYREGEARKGITNPRKAGCAARGGP